MTGYRQIGFDYHLILLVSSEGTDFESIWCAIITAGKKASNFVLAEKLDELFANIQTARGNLAFG